MTTVRTGSAKDLDVLGPLWRSFYEDQRAQGMHATVPANGFEEWSSSLRAALGRFACLVVAEEGDKVVGFVAGRTRSAPKYLGGTQAGWVTEVWVEPAYRRQRLAEQMVRAAIDWFRGQGVTRIELQVVPGNEGARRLYARLGFADELVQMVREVGRDRS